MRELSNIYIINPKTLAHVWAGRMPLDNAWRMMLRSTIQMVVEQKGKLYEAFGDGTSAEYKPWPTRMADNTRF